MGFCSKVLVRQDKNSDQQEAHNEHFSTFTNEPERNFQNDPPPNEPYHYRYAIYDRADHHVGIIALGWGRRQLSHHPAFLRYSNSLGASSVAVLLRILVSVRRGLHSGG